jgi:hypothetical protein
MDFAAKYALCYTRKYGDALHQKLIHFETGLCIIIVRHADYKSMSFIFSFGNYIYDITKIS